MVPFPVAISIKSRVVRCGSSSAGLGVGGVKLTCHQEVVGRPALRGSAEFGDNAAGDRPFAAERGAMPFAG